MPADGRNRLFVAPLSDQIIRSASVSKRKGRIQFEGSRKSRPGRVPIPFVESPDRPMDVICLTASGFSSNARFSPPGRQESLRSAALPYTASGRWPVRRLPPVVRRSWDPADGTLIAFHRMSIPAGVISAM